MTSATLQRPKWLSVKEVALRLGIQKQSVRRKIAAGEIPTLQLGGRGCALRILEDELSRWLEEHRNVDSAPALDAGTPLERREPDFPAVEAQAPGGEAA